MTYPDADVQRGVRTGVLARQTDDRRRDALADAPATAKPSMPAYRCPDGDPGRLLVPATLTAIAGVATTESLVPARAAVQLTEGQSVCGEVIVGELAMPPSVTGGGWKVCPCRAMPRCGAPEVARSATPTSQASSVRGRVACRIESGPRQSQPDRDRPPRWTPSSRCGDVLPSCVR